MLRMLFGFRACHVLLPTEEGQPTRPVTCGGLFCGTPPPPIAPDASMPGLPVIFPEQIVGIGAGSVSDQHGVSGNLGQLLPQDRIGLVVRYLRPVLELRFEQIANVEPVPSGLAPKCTKTTISSIPRACRYHYIW
jgi:hypothetical protein